MRATLLLTSALVLAGCMTAEQDPAPIENASVDPEDVPDVDPALAAAAKAAEGTPSDVPFSYSGETPEGVCGPFGCQFMTEGSEDFHPLSYAGRATKLVVEVTYADVKPGMEFYIGLCKGEGESEADVSCGDYTTGPSPLTVEFDLADLPAGQGIALSTGALNGASTATGVIVFTASSFEATGAITVVPN